MPYLGALISAGLVPGASVAMGDGGPGCLDRKTIPAEITNSMVSGWEAMMTFTLISVECMPAVWLSPGTAASRPWQWASLLWPGAMAGELDSKNPKEHTDCML